MSVDDSNGRNGGATFLIGFIAGSMLGAGLALLFAPRPGDETRREVAERAHRQGDVPVGGRQGARGRAGRARGTRPAGRAAAGGRRDLQLS